MVEIAGEKQDSNSESSITSPGSPFSVFATERLGETDGEYIWLATQHNQAFMHSMLSLLYSIVFSWHAAGAIISHVLFNRYEPNTLHFVGGLSVYSQVTTMVQWLQGNSVSASISTAFSSVGLYLLFLVFSITIYRLSPWHPLARFPGPRMAHLTKWWMVNQVVFRGGRHAMLQQLHAYHGPWVRVGPNEISVNLPSAIRPIYNKLDRARFYQGAPFSADTLISVLDRETHKRRRQPWANALNSESLASYLPTVYSRIAQLMQILKDKNAEGHKVNLDYWTYLFFCEPHVDTMGDIGFSGGFESMKAGKDAEGWLSTLAMGVFFASSMGQVPWLKDLVNILPRRGPIDSFHRSIDKKIHQIDNDSTSPKAKRLDILGFLLDSSADAKLTPGEVIADAALIVVSATDTSVQVVVTIFRYLGLDMERQSRLQAEIDDVLSNVGDGGDDALTLSISRLPFLDACVQESLRIVPPGPFGPLRTTGVLGAHICGEYVPPNTTIHVPVYTMHRDQAYFGSLAGDFIPERWIDNNPIRKGLESNLPPIDHTSFMPFGAGFGSCIGKNLAIQNVKLLVANIVYHFEVTCSSDFDAGAFDRSYKEFGIWQHKELPVTLTARNTP
ncbi:cytochrome P450 [Mycena sp. CBHHK59/15]|nr:cytochrome P450 [Mycena sp. CBHHK59/15]